MSRLRSVLLLVRDVEASATFFERGLQLSVARSPAVGPGAVATAEIEAGGTGAEGILISLRATDGNEAALSTGYSPFLNFDVKDMDVTVPQVLALGARLDGPISYAAHGKVIHYTDRC